MSLANLLMGDTGTPKPPLTIAILGSHQSGKSTLLGHLTALAMPDALRNRMMSNYTRQTTTLHKHPAAPLTWVCDRSPVERDHNMTTFSKYLEHKTDAARVTMIDPPGGERFDKFMTSAIQQADVCLVVVDAQKYLHDLSPTGGLYEQLLMAKAFHVEQLVVVVNKMDLLGYCCVQFLKIVEHIQNVLQSIGFVAYVTPQDIPHVESQGIPLSTLPGVPTQSCAVHIIHTTQRSTSDETFSHALLHGSSNNSRTPHNAQNIEDSEQSAVLKPHVHACGWPTARTVQYGCTAAQRDRIMLIPILPISGWCGDNLLHKIPPCTDRSDGVDTGGDDGDVAVDVDVNSSPPLNNLSWHSDANTLLQQLNLLRPKTTTTPSSSSSLQTSLRLSVQDVYRIPSIGTVVCGKLEHGALRPGMRVQFAPKHHQLEFDHEVYGIESHHKWLDTAHTGEQIGINISTPHEQLKRGMVLSGLPHGIASWDGVDVAAPAVSFYAYVVLFNHDVITTLRHGACPVVHVHSAVGACRVEQIDWGFAPPLLNNHNTNNPTAAITTVTPHHNHASFEEYLSHNSNITRNPDFLRTRDCPMGVVKFVPLAPLVVEAASAYPNLARFVLRDQGRVVGMGVVLSVDKATPPQQDPTPDASTSPCPPHIITSSPPHWYTQVYVPLCERFQAVMDGDEAALTMTTTTTTTTTSPTPTSP